MRRKIISIFIFYLQGPSFLNDGPICPNDDDVVAAVAVAVLVITPVIFREYSDFLNEKVTSASQFHRLLDCLTVCIAHISAANSIQAAIFAAVCVAQLLD